MRRNNIYFTIIMALAYWGLFSAISFYEERQEPDFVPMADDARIMQQVASEQCGAFIDAVLRDMRKTREAQILSTIHPAIATIQTAK